MVLYYLELDMYRKKLMIPHFNTGVYQIKEQFPVRRLWGQLQIFYFSCIYIEYASIIQNLQRNQLSVLSIPEFSYDTSSVLVLLFEPPILSQTKMDQGIF
jgi:hypothetical protein